jgi:hypothetical protein
MCLSPVQFGLFKKFWSSCPHQKAAISHQETSIAVQGGDDTKQTAKLHDLKNLCLWKMESAGLTVTSR